MKKQLLYLFVGFGCVSVFVVSYFVYSRGTPLELPLYRLQIGEKMLNVQIAATPDQWHKGLSFRQELAGDEGMLFVFDEPQVLNFSTRDTYVPLGLAFIADNCIIQEVMKMDITAYNKYSSSQPARAALEAPLGWFENNANVTGWALKIPELSCPNNWQTCCMPQSI